MYIGWVIQFSSLVRNCLVLVINLSPWGEVFLILLSVTTEFLVFVSVCVCVCVCVFCFLQKKGGGHKNQLTWEFLAIWKDSQTCKYKRDLWHHLVMESKWNLRISFGPSCLHSHPGQTVVSPRICFTWCWSLGLMAMQATHTPDASLFPRWGRDHVHGEVP